MNQVSTGATGSKRGKLWMQTLVGALFGGGAMSLALLSADRLSISGRLQVDEIIALGVGVVYLIMGVFVGLGIAFPKPGSKLLNVADKQEILDERKLLAMSAAGSILVGLSMLILVAATPALKLLDPITAAILFGACMLVSTVASYVTLKEQDELAKQIYADSAIVGMTLISTLFGVWAALAHLGLTPMFSPLGFLSGVLGLYLLGVFWVAGKRGLMVQ